MPIENWHRLQNNENLQFIAIEDLRGLDFISGISGISGTGMEQLWSQ